MNSKNKQTVLYVFTNDLRLGDNQLFSQALLKATIDNKSLLCLYCLPKWSFPQTTDRRAIGFHRFQFLLQALQDLKQQLHALGLSLVVRLNSMVPVLTQMTFEDQVSDVFYSQSAGFYERAEWRAVHNANPNITFQTGYLNNLFKPSDLPFEINELPKHFTPFRKKVEALRISKPQVLESREVQHTFSNKLSETDQWSQLVLLAEPTTTKFKGGEQAASQHLNHYFDSQAPSSYKEVRNQLLGWENSTKFSPWLALGCVSPQQIMQSLRQYETENGANDSTYWIYFELLWREFFHWNAIKQGTQLFNNFRRSDDGKHDKASFKHWTNGDTGEPLIDACMRELKLTGYLSNRGRQIAASYLIHELSLDWRLGASYFEKILLDYDVASNWGNWQYIAGVGADPRGGRHFNVEKQQQIHDPEGRYIRHWSTRQGDKKDILWSDFV